MSSLVARLQRFLPWSNTPRAWGERASLVGVLAVAATLIVYASDLDLWLLVAAWAVLLLTAAVLFRRGWLKAFGPMLWYDLVRTGRRARTYLIRGAYLLILLAVLWMLYVNAWPHSGYRGAPLNSQIARFAESFLYTFLTTQFVLMLILTPAYTAGAIAEEKQKKTIQFLLATDLRNHEIVLGKLGSRMAHLGLLLLAGLPVLSAVQFLGGVDPHLILAGFAGTAVTLASTAGVGILASVVARPSRAAVFLAYGAVLAYAVVCWLGVGALAVLPRQTFFDAGSPVVSTVENVLDVVEAGNPVMAVENTFNGTDPFETALLHSLGAYALFHGVVAVATTLTASVLLRRACLREPPPPSVKHVARRPPVGDQPMVWKEVHAERGPARRWFVWLPVSLLIAASLLPLVWAWYERPTYEPWLYWRAAVNAWVRIVGTIMACLTLIGVGVQAAYSIRTERDRETFDTLLTSPLSSEAILYGKWLGAILSVRWMLIWLGLIWGLGLLGGGLNFLAVPLLVLAWCVYAAAMASLGLWFSLVSRTSLRAVLYTILAAIGLSVGHWLIWLPCGCLTFWARIPGEGIGWLLTAQGGLTPPAVLGGYLSFGYDEPFGPDIFSRLITFALCGDVLWGVFAGMVWSATNQRFKRASGRMDVGAIRYRKPRSLRLS